MRVSLRSLAASSDLMRLSAFLLADEERGSGWKHRPESAYMQRLETIGPALGTLEEVAGLPFLPLVDVVSATTASSQIGRAHV